MGRPVFAAVYKIEHVPSGRVYVGSTVNVLKRMAEHRRRLLEGRHTNSQLQRAWSTHGEGSFLFSVVELIADRGDLREAEQRAMDLHSCYERGFNRRPAADTQQGHRHSAESRGKMSLSHVGNPLPESTRRAMRAAIAAMPKEVRERLNRQRAEASREMHKNRSAEERAAIGEKIGAALKGRSVSEDTRKRISASLSGRKLPEAHVKAIRAALGKISESDRQRIVQWRDSGDSFRSIARRIGVTHQAVRKAYQRQVEVS